MQLALKQANVAYRFNEVPVGAVIVLNNIVVASAFNLCNRLKNPTFHAELLAVTKALSLIDINYLPECSIYVTVEPCLMCWSALTYYRFDKIVYGAGNPKFGFKSTGVDLNKFNAYFKPKVYGGILKSDCDSLMTAFFKKNCRV